MILGLILATILLIIASAVVVPTGSLGKFERARRQRQSAHDLEVERELYYSEIVSSQRVLISLFIVSLAGFSIASFGWLLGVLVALFIALEYGAISRQSWIRNTATRYYSSHVEAGLISLIQKYPKPFTYTRMFVPDTQEISLHSREELEHLIESSHRIISDNDKKLLLNGLQFGDKLVKEIMTPRTVIDAVNTSELLGPLVLDDLHKKGHSRFPVIEHDIDHVVGVLHLRDILTLDTSHKHTAKVENSMEPRVFYIHEDQSLEHALNAFIKTHHHLFIVVNEYRETVGLLTIEDVIEALLGRSIIDEFDTHEDLRAVASRNPRANNHSTGSSDV